MFPPIEFRMQGGFAPSNNALLTRTATAASYTVLPTDYLIGVTDTSAARTITLPTVPGLNQTFIIKDESGAAATNNISITANGTITIDGLTSVALNTNYGALQVYFSGTNYFIL